MMASWPDADALAGYVNKEAERAIEMVTQSVSSIRSTRARYGFSPRVELSISVKPVNEDMAVLFTEQQSLIKALANIAVESIDVNLEKPDESTMCLAEGIELYVILTGLVDFGAERKRLEKEIAALEKDFVKFDKKLSNPGFLSKAKPEIIEKDRAKLADISDKLIHLKTQLEDM